MILPHLGDAYCFAYLQKILSEDSLPMAIDRYGIALQSVPAQAQSKLQYKIGKAYSAIYMDKRDAADLHSAINYLKLSITGQVSHEEIEDAMMEISDLYMCQYQEKKAREYLDAAIYWARRAAHIQYEEGLPRILRKIASLLTVMYKDFLDRNSLDEAIECYKQVWARRETHQLEQLSTFYFNFATALMRRNAILPNNHPQKRTDLLHAIQLLELAVALEQGEDNLASSIQLKIAKDRLAYEEQIMSTQTGVNHQIENKLPDQDLPSHYPVMGENQPNSRQPSFIEIQNPPQRGIQPPYNSTSSSPGIYNPGYHQANPNILVQLNYQPMKGKYFFNLVSYLITSPAGEQSRQDNRKDALLTSTQASSSKEKPEDPTSRVPIVDSPTEITSPDDIKPTNLTGRVIKTSILPAAEGGFSSIYRGRFGTTKVGKSHSFKALRLKHPGGD
jgi:hypothetical protein